MMTKEQQKLVEENYLLVNYVVNKYFKKDFFYIDKEDLIAEGYWWLCRCSCYYDSDKSKFSTFACNCLIRHLSDYVSQQFDKGKQEVSIELLENYEPEVFDTYSFDIKDDVKKFLQHYMCEKHIDMSILHYIDGVDWNVIATKYGYKTGDSAFSSVKRGFSRVSKMTNIDKFKNIFF